MSARHRQQGRRHWGMAIGLLVVRRIDGEGPHAEGLALPKPRSAYLDPELVQRVMALMAE
jgi:hypothetical protein